MTREGACPTESWITKLLLMLFPPPGQPLTIHPHLPKPDLLPRYSLEALSFEIHNVKAIPLYITTLVNYTYLSNFSSLPY